MKNVYVYEGYVSKDQFLLIFVDVLLFKHHVVFNETQSNVKCKMQQIRVSKKKKK